MAGYYVDEARKLYGKRIAENGGTPPPAIPQPSPAASNIAMSGADVHARIGQSAISTMNTMANLSASTTS